MANEISVASMLADGVLSAFIVSDFQARNTRPDDLRAALERVEWRANSGSPSQRTALFDDDFTFTAASSEISGGVSNADPDWGYFQLTAARRLLPLTLTDLEAGVRGPNGADPALVAGMIVRAAGKTITDMACAVAAAATEEVGDGLGPMTVDLWMDAKTQLEETATPAPYNGVLTPKAYGELVESLRGETGTLSWQPAVAEVVEATGGTFKGTLAGVGVWVSGRVDTTDAGAVSQSFMFGKNGIRYLEAPVGAFMVDAVSAGAQIVDFGVVGIEFDRDAANGLTTMIGNYYPAVSLGEDLAVVRIQTATGA